MLNAAALTFQSHVAKSSNGIARVYLARVWWGKGGREREHERTNVSEAHRNSPLELITDWLLAYEPKAAEYIVCQLGDGLLISKMH